MKTINVLFSSGGGSGMIGIINHLKKLKRKINIHVTDMILKEEIKFFCDSYTIVPKISSPEYKEEIINLCRKKDIDVIIPCVRLQSLLDTFAFELREYFDVSFCYSIYANQAV